MAHREDIKAFLANISLTNNKVVDWCAGTKPVEKYVKHKGTTFFTIDKLPHVDSDLCADVLECEEFGDDFDTAFCMEGIEHVKYPDILLKNINRNLIGGGKLYMSVPFLMDIHSEEDYWRFTDQGLKLLLKNANFIVDEIKATEGKQGWLVTAHKENGY